jgi:DNA polymerase-3 subunit beta
VGERIIFVRFGDYKLSSILIEGQFPNYERVIPKNQEFNFVVNRAEMLESVHRVSGFAEKGKRILMGLSNGTLKISTADDDYGSVEEEIPFQYEGDDVSIAMNYRYIEEPLKAIDTEEVRFRFTDTSKAVTVVPEPETDFVHVVMPMQQP